MVGGLQPTDAELVIAARRGDRSAFDMLVGRYQRRATAVAYRLLGNVDDAMEVTQDAFCRAYDKLAGLSDPARFGPWFLRTVTNQSLNRRRRRAIRRTQSLDAPGGGADSDERVEWNLADQATATPAEMASAAELKENIREALDELPEKQRSALVLFSIEKLPQKQVAEMLNISVEAVKWHVFAARKKLKERFRDYL